VRETRTGAFLSEGRERAETGHFFADSHNRVRAVDGYEAYRLEAIKRDMLSLDTHLICVYL
jgi:hypothetical protein